VNVLGGTGGGLRLRCSLPASLLVVDTSCHVMKITKVDVTPGGVIISGSIQANVNQAPYSLSLSQVQRL
jgi:hypothetical protein